MYLRFSFLLVCLFGCRVSCVVLAQSQPRFLTPTSSGQKKDYKDPIQDRRPINTCSPIATPRHVAGPQVWRSAAWRISLRGLWLHARERRCSWRLRASTFSMCDERCCVHGEVRAPRYVLLVAPIALESLPVASFVVQFVQVIHALRLGGRLRSSSPHPHLSNPRSLPCCLSATLCLASLSVCFCAGCRLCFGIDI